MQNVQIDGTMCQMPDNVDVSLYATETGEPRDIQLDPAFLARLEASAIITRLAHSDRDQSVARMATYDRLRAVTGVY